MCGILGIIDPNLSVDQALATRMIRSISHRGPDGSGLFTSGQVTLAHTRLAIIDVDARSDQPMKRGTTRLVYNGELWNYRDLRLELQRIGRMFSTLSDTEVVCHALDEWGEDALPLFEGMFALAWQDTTTNAVTLARDRFGEIPLHVSDGHPNWGWASRVVFGSEIKPVLALANEPVKWVEPGTLIRYEPQGSAWMRSERAWYDAPTDTWMIDRREGAAMLREELARSVSDRAMSDRPVCALVSGGVDSTVILHELAKHGTLVAYTAVMNERSRDLKCARAAAKAARVPLIEVPIPMPTPEDLRYVVDTIEMPHKAQVEIGWACDVLAERIAADGFRVVFSGEGSDELWASYGFAYHALKHVFSGLEDDPNGEFARYRKDLFVGQHRKNFARCNKIFMAHGVECRLPFLHRRVVELGLGMPLNVVMDRRPDGKPSRNKAVLYDAYSDVLPAEIMDRPKVAFQDGLGLKDAIAAMLPNAKASYLEWAAAYK